ncbi:zf-RVT domain-containing protein [Cephalotus follicularis]|uniref:Zf-RVT domain-containing protein n=1 Tax=Cephalotus follicularis TaxID=3775 RepID=A0A1Q3CD42_CEPFO|nr:zf-RVT domain-containing protein [Cephalotus follicularis]
MHGESIHALYGHRVIYDAGLGRLAFVKKVLRAGRWCWPPNFEDLIEIQRRVQDIPISLSPDSIFWETVGNSFSTKMAWQGIRSQSSEALWHNLVWHPSRIPKHAFCLWLAILAAHKTRDKLLAIGVLQSASCVFYCGAMESLEHIYFQCPYTENIWKAVFAKCNIYRPIFH